MKNKIEELIYHHKNSKNEVFSILEELNSLDSSKITQEDLSSLECLRVEYGLRLLFITDLESLL